MDYDKMSLVQLREAAKNNGMKNISALKKQELIDMLKKESASVEKAAQKLEKLAAKEEQKNSEEKAAATAKRGRTKKSGEEPEKEAPSGAKEVHSSKKENGPAVKEPQTAKKENKPSVKESQPAKKESGPSVKESQSAKKESGPSVKESQPVKKENGAAVKESQPVKKENGPARKEPQLENKELQPARGIQTEKNEIQQPNKSTQAVRTETPSQPANRGIQTEKTESQPVNKDIPAERKENRNDKRPVQQNAPQNPQNQNYQRYNNATEGKIYSTTKITSEEREALDPRLSPEIEHLDSGDTKMGILEVMPEGFGFIRCDNFLPGENDVYVSPAQIRKFNLKTGDIISGNTKVRLQTEKFSALLYIKTINGIHPNEAVKRKRFEELTPVFPHERIRLETRGCIPALRIVDLLSPIGKGQRGMIVSQPKAGKTTLLKQIAKAMQTNYPELHIIILLIDERPEEVTDMKESIQGSNVEVIYSTFDELPENHKRVSEMAIERAKRLVEHGRDVVVLLDSITRLARAYNLTCQPSGRTLSGGLDPAALHMPKKFFGAARCMREGGSLTVLATALVETGSRMDDVVFEEFKGTGNMELVLDRNLSERRIFPAIDLPRSSTRREDLLLNKDEIDANNILRRAFNSSKADDVVEKIIGMFARTRTNAEFIDMLKNTRLA